MLTVFVFLAVLVGLGATSPIYWYDMEKQLLYSFEDPDFFRFNTYVSDSKNQPIYDITRAKKSVQQQRVEDEDRENQTEELNDYLDSLDVRV
ncbi:hypothetical protein L596_005391 [Steinernema carpocapsae]|uniref:Uncharacterized protein n=1 Tax=Steinernema carpocapsae TaxID=34508 RepID=A0A4U8UYW0_STECR|nr:hypothetical protein L596_005391 [Steinernema carpocapsae]